MLRTVFEAVPAFRAGAPNPSEYGGAEVAAARDTVQDLGWEIVAADEATGRIEATDTTFWFGFKDDIVVRIVSSNGGSLIDVRSVSREGRSDAGTNAKRIRNFLDKLQARTANRQACQIIFQTSKCFPPPGTGRDGTGRGLYSARQI